MTNAILNGWNSDYRVVDTETWQNAVLDILSSRQVEVSGQITDGDSLSQVVQSLRDKHFKVPGLTTDQEKLVEILGFRVVSGKVGKWTRGGYKFCQPARVVVL